MNSRAGGAVFAIGLAIVSGGCGGAIPKTHYYVLDLPAAPAVGSSQRPNPTPYTLAVMPLRAPEQLEQDRIVYRSSPVELDYYEYHRWAGRPASVLTTALTDRLRAQNVFSNVLAFDGRTKTDYLLRGSLQRLEEVDSSGSVSVRVEMTAEMIEVKTNRAAWSASCSQGGAVKVGEVKAVVEEISRGADACLAQITAGLEGFAKSLPPAPAPASAASPGGMRTTSPEWPQPRFQQRHPNAALPETIDSERAPKRR